MTRVPTVRVRNPSTGSYKTINVTELDDQHEVWHEQGDDFDPTALERVRSRPTDPAVRDAAAVLMLKIASFHVEQTGGNFTAMTDAEKLAVVSSMNDEFDLDMTRRRSFMREEREEREAESREQAARESARLSSEASETARQAAEKAEQATQDGQGTSGESQGGQEDDPGPGDDQTDPVQPGQTQDHPVDGSLYVEESARGKFYVAKLGKRVSRGLPTREDADRLKASMEAQS